MLKVSTAQLKNRSKVKIRIMHYNPLCKNQNNPKVTITIALKKLAQTHTMYVCTIKGNYWKIKVGRLVSSAIK